MAIKMRVNKDDDCTCKSCGQTKKLSVDMFDVMVGDAVFQLCDICMNAMFDKALSAISYTNGRVKQPSEIRKKNMRKRMEEARGSKWNRQM